MDTKSVISARRLLVAIPTYNNAGTLRRVIEDVKCYSDNIVVVNDGSTDSTQSIIDAVDVDSISYMPNRGKGYAIKRAIEYAHKCGYDYLLTMDSDGQHFASDIDRFVVELESTPDALIIGARNLQADNMPSKNTFANRFSNFWFFVETGIKLTDTQSGFRLYPIHKMRRMSLLCNRYEAEVEIIVRSAWRGIDVRNIPIKVYYAPDEERVSHFKPLKDFTRISILNSVLVTISLIYFYPLRFLRSLTRENIFSFIRDNITDTKEPNIKVASAISLGVFFGIFPIWGYQMVVAAIVAHMLRLNKVLTLVSSNISIPPMIPFILYGSFYCGAILFGRPMVFDLETITLERVYSDLMQYICGSVVLATIAASLSFVLAILSLSIFRHR